MCFLVTRDTSTTGCLRCFCSLTYTYKTYQEFKKKGRQEEELPARMPEGTSLVKWISLRDALLLRLSAKPSAWQSSALASSSRVGEIICKKAYLCKAVGPGAFSRQVSRHVHIDSALSLRSLGLTDGRLAVHALDRWTKRRLARCFPGHEALPKLAHPCHHPVRPGQFPHTASIVGLRDFLIKFLPRLGPADACMLPAQTSDFRSLLHLEVGCLPRVNVCQKFLLGSLQLAAGIVSICTATGL